MKFKKAAYTVAAATELVPALTDTKTDQIIRVGYLAVNVQVAGGVGSLFKLTDGDGTQLTGFPAVATNAIGNWEFNFPSPGLFTTAKKSLKGETTVGGTLEILVGYTEGEMIRPQDR